MFEVSLGLLFLILLLIYTGTFINRQILKTGFYISVVILVISYAIMLLQIFSLLNPPFYKPINIAGFEGCALFYGLDFIRSPAKKLQRGMQLCMLVALALYVPLQGYHLPFGKTFGLAAGLLVIVNTGYSLFNAITE